MMSKREFVDRKRVIDVVIDKGVNWRDILNLLNTSTEIPIYTEQEIVKPYLEKLLLKLKDCAYKEPEGSICFCEKEPSLIVALEDIMDEIDNLLSEQGDNK